MSLPPVRGKSFNFSETRVNRIGILNHFSEAGWTSFLAISFRLTVCIIFPDFLIIWFMYLHWTSIISIAVRSGKGEMHRLQCGGSRERHLWKLGKTPGWRCHWNWAWKELERGRCGRGRVRGMEMGNREVFGWNSDLSIWIKCGILEDKTRLRR